MASLPDLFSQELPDIHAVAIYMDDLLTEAIAEINREFGPQRLAKGIRTQEPLPIGTRQLSSYRTRIGTMLEYAVSTEMARILKARYGDTYLLTFAVAHEYPDFYLRDNGLTALLRIEMKAVDAGSDEQA